MKDENEDLYSGFPSQITRVTSKNLEQICKQAIDYAVNLHYSRRQNRIQRITKSKNSYAGYVSVDGRDYLNNAYGPDNIVQYVDYRLSKKKIDIIAGEWLEAPLNSTVYSINSAAKTAKFDNLVMANSIKSHKEQIKKLREVAGVNVYNGVDIDMDEKTLMDMMSAKSRNEMIMNYMLKKYIKTNGLKSDLLSNLMDVLLGAECYGKVYLDAFGRPKYRPIDNRFALYQESDNDPYLERSPYWGEQRPMFAHEILMEYPTLKPDEVEMIEEWGRNGAPGSDSINGSGYITNYGNTHLINTYAIEFLMFEPNTTKKEKTIKNGESIEIKNDLSNDYYVDNEGKLKKGVEKGMWQLDTKYRPILYEAVRIEGTIYTNLKKKGNVIASVENPTKYHSSYTGMLLNTINGERISLQESLEEIKEQYNVVRFQINRELAKSKGLVIMYDRAFLPKDPHTNEPLSFDKVLYKMVNEGIYDYNSAAEGFDGDTAAAAAAIKVHDLSISKSMPVLIQLAQELEATADIISGINGDRQGQTPASSTATNALNNLQNSRSVTKPIMFFFNAFCEKVMLRILEYTKVSWTYLLPEEGAMVIGDEAMGFLQVTKDISNDDFDVYLSDGQKEQEVRGYIRNVIVPASLNAKEMRPQDALEVEVQETLAEAQAVLAKGWDKIKQIEIQQQQMANQSQQAQVEQNLAAAKEAREDQQAHELGLKIVEGEEKKGIAAAQAVTDYNMAAMKAATDQVNTILQNPETP